MAKIILISLTLSLTTLTAQDAELRDMANTLAAQLQTRAKSPVAVTTFTNDGCGPSFGLFISNRLNILLVQTGKQFEVVTRNRLDEAFKEINLQLGRNYDSATFAKIGKQVGAKAMIRGDYTVLESKVSLNAEVLDVETGRVIGGHFVDIPLTGDVKGLIRCGGEAAAAKPGPAPGADPNRRLVGEPPPPPPPARMMTSEVGGLVFTLKGCTARTTEVTCDLSVVSPKEDRGIRLGRWSHHSHFFDQDGNEYARTTVAGANKSDNDLIDLTLVRDVNVQLRFKFAVTRDVTGISLLRIVGGVANQEVQADFRNIKVSN